MQLDYRAIGKRIREKRIKKNLTQEMLAASVGISNPHISNIERGRTKVSLSTLTDIANCLDTTVDELLCDNLKRGKVFFDEDISNEIKKCSDEDIKIVYDVIKSLVESLQNRRH